MPGLNEEASFGRYTLEELIGSGGMARVYFGWMQGAGSFRAPVAVKRLHPALAAEPAFASVLIDEARLMAAVRHANVASVLDVVDAGTEVLVVFEWIDGVPLDLVLRAARTKNSPVPAPIVAAIVRDICRGLHAAHEAIDPDGHPLAIVHRDVSPHNVMVARDGTVKLLDFGIAKARGTMTASVSGEVKGKPGYMAPEQMQGEQLDRRADLFAVGLVLWELLTLESLHATRAYGALSVLEGACEELPSSRADDPEALALAAVAHRALELDAADRWPTADAMARAIERQSTATQADVSDWVRLLAGDRLVDRASKAQPALPEAATVVVSAGGPGRGWAIWAVGIVGATLAVLAIGFAGAMERSPPVSAPASAGAAAEPAPPPPAPSAAASTSSAVSVVPAGSASRRRTRPSKSPAGSAAPSCAFPFTVAADGTKIPRPECF